MRSARTGRRMIAAGGGLVRRDSVAHRNEGVSSSPHDQGRQLRSPPRPAEGSHVRSASIRAQSGSDSSAIGQVPYDSATAIDEVPPPAETGASWRPSMGRPRLVLALGIRAPRSVGLRSAQPYGRLIYRNTVFRNSRDSQRRCRLAWTLGRTDRKRARPGGVGPPGRNDGVEAGAERRIVDGLATRSSTR